jgi:hypothetical protein
MVLVDIQRKLWESIPSGQFRKYELIIEEKNGELIFRLNQKARANDPPGFYLWYNRYNKSKKLAPKSQLRVWERTNIPLSTFNLVVVLRR